MIPEDYWSFIGMGILGLLIIIYLLHSKSNIIDSKIVFSICISCMLGAIIVFISNYYPVIPGFLVLFLFIIAFLNSFTEMYIRWKKRRVYDRLIIKID